MVLLCLGGFVALHSPDARCIPKPAWSQDQMNDKKRIVRRHDALQLG